MATTEEEDFSFPATTTADSPPRFLDWPPQWRRSATTSRRERSKGKVVAEEEGERFNLPSFPEFRSSSAKERSCASHGEEREEKMDMLWEDLNDDQFAINCGKFAQNSDISSPRRGVQISCVKALKLSKTNGHIISGKKTTVLVFIKVLKKVFLMQNSQSTIKKKKPSW